MIYNKSIRAMRKGLVNRPLEIGDRVVYMAGGPDALEEPGTVSGFSEDGVNVFVLYNATNTVQATCYYDLKPLEDTCIIKRIPNGRKR